MLLLTYLKEIYASSVRNQNNLQPKYSRIADVNKRRIKEVFSFSCSFTGLYSFQALKSEVVRWFSADGA